MFDYIEKNLLSAIADMSGIPETGAFNIRKNGGGVARSSTETVTIESKKDKQGIDIKVKPFSKADNVHIPVIVTESGVSDKVYNDFYIGKNANVVIVAGCGIHNSGCETSQHDGIHAFYLEENAHVKYIEKHYGDGTGTGKRILNPQTIINLKKGATLEIESVQIKGVDSTIRTTNANLEDNATLLISEKVMTHDNQLASTVFNVNLNGKNSSVQVASRSIAKNNSKQEFTSNIIGNNECFGHVECDAIIMDKAKVTSTPQIVANNIDANLVHEAAIGKIAGEQVVKLMTLGLSEKEAEDYIISGFLK